MGNRAPSTVGTGIHDLAPAERHAAGPVAVSRRAAAGMPPPSAPLSPRPQAPAAPRPRTPAPAAVERPETPPQQPEPDAGLLIPSLIRRLLDEAQFAAEQGCESEVDVELPGFSGVLFDVEVDGFRYRLVRSAAQSASPLDILSPREHEIARMVAQGHPNKTIAAVLDISSWTVGTYLRRIFAKLNVGSRAAMVATLASRSQFDAGGSAAGSSAQDSRHSHPPSPAPRGRPL